MRTTLALDDELIAKAQSFTGLKEKSALVREALKALIERESARRLAGLGGTEPDIERRRGADTGMCFVDPRPLVGRSCGRSQRSGGLTAISVGRWHKA
jgi:Arc/MetJ family transcription regulator